MHTEKQIEQRLKYLVEKSGGQCLKWTGTKGAPDRIVILPNGVVKFVELKNSKGKISPIQKVIHERLRALGCDVIVMWSYDDIDDFIAKQN